MSAIYDVTCDGCGSSLEVLGVSLTGMDELEVKVGVCSTCEKSAFERGKEEGKKEAEAEFQEDKKPAQEQP